MAKFKVWGEWQGYDEATVQDAASADAAAGHVAETSTGAFPDWNDGDTTRIYVREADAEDGDEEWCPENDPETTAFLARLRITSEITISPKR